MLSIGLDSGSSWVAAVSCSVMTLLLLIPVRISGIMYVTIIQQFSTDRQTASYPSMVMLFLRGMGGPVIGYFSMKFGVYRITLLGCILATLGIGLCFLATTVGHTTFFIGWFYGLGLAFGNILLPEIMKCHFEKHLATSLGLCSVGYAISGLILPPIAEYLFFEYGPSGSYLLLSAIMLHSVPACLLMRAMNNGKNYCEPPLRSAIREFLCFNTSEKLKVTWRRGNASAKHTKLPNEFRDDHNKVISETHRDESAKTVQKIRSSNENIRRISGANVKNVNDPEESNDQTEEKIKKTSSCVSKTKYKIIECNRPSNVKIPNALDCHKDYDRFSLKDLNEPNRENSPWRILLEPTFHICMVNQSVIQAVSFLCFTTMVDYARDKNIDSIFEVWLFTVFSLAEFIGFIGLGWITDGSYISRVSFATLCSVMMAAGCLAVVAARSFPLMACGLAAVSLFTGALLTLLTRIMCGLSEGDRLTIALASKQFLMAPILISGSSLIGFFRVSNGSYDGLYYLLAGVCVFCGLLILLLPSNTRKGSMCKATCIHLKHFKSQQQESRAA